jgi:hypothetical protein
MGTSSHNVGLFRPLRLWLLLLALLAASASNAQTQNKPKLYRWTDNKGVVHYGDHVPPQYANKDREILNKEGVSVGFQQGEVSAAQKAEQARKKAAEDKAEAARQDKLRRDRMLLQTYTSVQDIEDLRDRRLELMASQIRVTQLYLDNLRDRLAKLQKQASAFKPANKKENARPLPQDLADDIARTTSSIDLYEKTLSHAREEREQARAQFAGDIKRFKELNGG